MDERDKERALPPQEKRGKHWLAVVVVWLLFTLTVLAIGLPHVRSAIHQSGVLRLLQEAQSPLERTKKTQAEVWFYTLGGTLTPFREELVRKGGSLYHDTFESLLAGPSFASLQKGAISAIQPGTTLHGLTLSNKVLYIDLSKNFTESEDIQGAYEQLKRTGRGFSQVKDIVLLIEGERATVEDER